MPLKLLAVGDLHLGRRPSRLPDELSGRAGKLGPAKAWERLVDAAIKARVDVVALAGDVVDRGDDFFEAYRELHFGVERLSDENIRVLGVAGNHDVDVLPRLEKQIESFELVGEGGEWQKVEIQAGGESLSIWGWSFPQARVDYSPLAGAELPRGRGQNLGLLHCDLGQKRSPYAPVLESELNSAGLDGWLLGHVHKPDSLSIDQPVGYLGCVTGMNPGERGARGPWLISISGGRISEFRQWTLAPMRYQPLEIDIGGISDVDHIQGLLVENIRLLDEEVAASYRPADAVALRVTFTGRSSLGEAAERLLSENDRDHILTGKSGTHYFVEKVEALTSPVISLKVLAKQNDPLGLLASRLLLLDEPDDQPERMSLVSEARQSLEARAAESQWNEFREQAVSDEIAEHFLRASGMRLLEKMLAQNRQDGEP